MNTPDDATIQSWLNGELEGNALKQMEAWAELHAEELEAKMGWDSLAAEISEAIPASQEPPYAEFFNERVKHHAVDLPSMEQAQPEHAPSLWRRFNWLFAPTALAGMALCFFLGMRVDQDASAASAVASIELDSVYTPASGVSSEVVVSEGSTVIVLDGLEAIPDTLDIVMGETSVGDSPRMLVKAERTMRYF